jgi:Tfp pilus assembly protein PilF
MSQLAAKFQQAFALQKKGQLARAQMLYEEIVKAEPRHFKALNLLGVIAAQTRNPAQAVQLFERAIAVDPHNAVAYGNRGLALHQLGQFDAALASYDQALAINPQQADAMLHRGNLFKDREQFAEALENYDRAIAVKPNYAEAFSNSGFVLKELGQLAAALARYDRAIAITPGYVSAHCNRAFTRLLAGDFEHGWVDYEWRRKLEQGSRFPQPLWLGKDSIAGKTILLHSEQGFGDTLQFCRYAKLVSERGARVILEVQQPLVGLLTGLTGVTQLIATGDALPAFDYQCPLMSLPLAFDTRIDTIPCATAYLHGDPAKIARWRRRLGERTRTRVGLVWSGRSTHHNDRNRSIALAELIEYLPADFQYVCLQKDIREPDRQTLQAHPAILSFADELADFSDSAALCECMDVVITVDTSVAHLSGALGLDAWILLPFNPEWRWLLERNDSPWYATVRLRRQKKMRDWNGILTEIRQDLLHLAQRRSPMT